jgi:chemotaxis protein methyltransferase CheR
MGGPIPLMSEGHYEHDPRPRGEEPPLPSTRPLGMTPALFRAFRELAYDKAGIQLRDGKETLLATRIARRMRDLGVADASEYLARLRADSSGDEVVRFLDCISTNLTSFYREKEHFIVIAEEASRQLMRGERRFRVWSAAAASGEEAYTIALTLAEVYAGRDVDHRVFATDISTRALAAARSGRYTAQQLAPVPDRLRRRYFSPVPPQGEHRDLDATTVYQASDELRHRMVFGRVNLAKPPWPMNGAFDVIMCRNVMIYFDQLIRQRLVYELEALLRPGGLLMVGQAETLSGLRSSLDRIGPSIYRTPESRPRSG